MPQANAAEMEARVTAVYKMLLRGGRRQNILEHAEKEGWNVTPRQVDKYIAKANKIFKKQAAVDRDIERGLALEQLTDLYADARSMRDNRTGLDVRKERSKITDLYPPPQPRTLIISSSDEKLIIQLFEALVQAGHKPREFLEKTLQRLAEVKK